ncbi:hypothetical protein MRX96_019208 [Rhipicephalus microplus]
MVQQPSTLAAAVSAVGPVAHETMFLPELTKTPLRSSIPWTAAKAMASTAPLHDTKAAGARSRVLLLATPIESALQSRAESALVGHSSMPQRGQRRTRRTTMMQACQPLTVLLS